MFLTAKLNSNLGYDANSWRGRTWFLISLMLCNDFSIRRVSEKRWLGILGSKYKRKWVSQYWKVAPCTRMEWMNAQYGTIGFPMATSTFWISLTDLGEFCNVESCGGGPGWIQRPGFPFYCQLSRQFRPWFGSEVLTISNSFIMCSIENNFSVRVPIKVTILQRASEKWTKFTFQRTSLLNPFCIHLISTLNWILHRNKWQWKI